MSEVTTIPYNLLAMKRRNKRPLVISVRTQIIMEGTKVLQAGSDLNVPDVEIA